MTSLGRFYHENSRNLAKTQFTGKFTLLICPKRCLKASLHLSTILKPKPWLTGWQSKSACFKWTGWKIGSGAALSSSYFQRKCTLFTNNLVFWALNTPLGAYFICYEHDFVVTSVPPILSLANSKCFLSSNNSWALGHWIPRKTSRTF